MLSKKEIKDIQSLSHKKFREALNLFVAEGPKIVGELAQQVPQQIERIYALKSWIENHPFATALHTIEVSEAELQRISGLQTPNAVLALVHRMPTLAPEGDGCMLYLDAIQDPGNFGTIIRTADWFNVKHVVCSEGCADLYNPKVVQSTMASIVRVNVYEDADGSWLRNQKLPVYAASLHGKALTAVSPVDSCVLVIGNESKGIRPELLELAHERITIPRKGKAESLNAAVATGILLSHFIR